MNSKDVFSLRKIGRLDEALKIAYVLYNNDPDDDWNKRALVWTLIDIQKRRIIKPDKAGIKMPEIISYPYTLDNFHEIKDNLELSLKNDNLKVIQTLTERLNDSVKRVHLTLTKLENIL